jgi:hypothetical protein
MADHDSVYPDNMIQFLTVASDDVTNIGTQYAYSFNNTLPVPLKFESSRVEVALFMLHYENIGSGGSTPQDRIALINSSVVRFGERVGSKSTDVMRIVTLRTGVNTFQPQVLQWVPANLEGREINRVGLSITNPDQTDVVDLQGVTFATFGFRVLEE